MISRVMRERHGQWAFQASRARQVRGSQVDRYIEPRVYKNLVLLVCTRSFLHSKLASDAINTEYTKMNDDKTLVTFVPKGTKTLRCKRKLCYLSSALTIAISFISFTSRLRSDSSRPPANCGVSLRWSCLRSTDLKSRCPRCKQRTMKERKIKANNKKKGNEQTRAFIMEAIYQGSKEAWKQDIKVGGLSLYVSMTRRMRKS